MLRVIAHLPNGEKLATFIRPPGKSRVRDLAGIVGAAGVVFTTPDHKVLLLKRAAGSEHSGTWGFPAGKLEQGETPRFGARREVREELGGKAPNGDMTLLGFFPMPSGERFAAFWQEVEEEFKPKLNGEHTDYQWADLAALPDGLHPGTEDILATGRLGYMALAHELVEYLQAKAQQTKDDAPMGHPFYGNQYTDVPLGPKPTEAKSKIAKHAVHELLSSGHPWTVEELAKITGHSNAQTLKSWLSMFKSEKTAGSKGVLNVKKNPDGTYQVVKAGGLPAEPAPPVAPPVAEQPQQATEPPPGAPQAAEPALPPAPPAPEPEFAPHTSGYVASPPAEPVSKAEADAHYEQHMNKLFFGIWNTAKIHQVSGPLSDLGWHDLAKRFKLGKANGMAKWAAMVQGKEIKAKPVQVFPEDVKFVKALADLAPDDGAGVKEAFAQWKKDTHAAKIAPPPTPPAPPPAAAPAPAQEPPKVEPPPEELAATGAATKNSVFAVPDSIVPADHNHISAGDFESAKGLGSSHFVAGMSKLKKLMENISSDAVGNKKAIQNKLTDLLHASSEFQEVREAVKQKYAGQSYSSSAEARLISSWASSSGDHRPLSVAAQLAIRDVFKMPKHEVETTAFHYLQSYSEDQTYANAAEELGYKVDTPAKMEKFKKALRDFAMAQYHATQDFFKQHGMTEIYLVRGMKVGSADVNHVKLKLQPASSFSSNYSTAHSFASSYGTVFAVRVPVSQVIGSYLTGYGCTNEHEVVVLSHGSLEAVAVPSNAASSATSMNATIKNSIHKLKKKDSWKAPDVSSMKGHDPFTAAATPSGAPAPSASTSWSAKEKAAWKPFAASMPKKPSGAKNGWATHAYKAAVAGNKQLFDHYLQAFHEAKAQSGKAYPASTKWMNEVQLHLQNSLADHAKVVAALPQKKTAAVSTGTTAAGAAKPLGTSSVFGTPMPKTASFYQKLSKAVTGHPNYNEHGYKAMKELGATNEQIYQTYQHMGAGGASLVKGLTPEAAATTYAAIYKELKSKALLP